MALKKKINVLILESMFHAGGIENLIYSIVKRMNREKYGIHLCTLYDPGPMGKPFLDIGFPFYHNVMRNKLDIRGLFRLRKIVKKWNIDLIYVITQPLTILWGFILGKLCGIPVICLLGNTVIMNSHIKLNIYRLLLPFVDKVIAQAKTQKAHWVKSVRIQKDLVTVIYNGINIEEFSTKIVKKAILADLGIPFSTMIVGIIGRLVPLKGIDIFLEAARLVLEAKTDVHFVSVGGGPEYNRLKAHAEELGISDKVHFLGFREDLLEVSSVFSVAVLASRTEALPMVILEYMALGKATVATRVGSIEEIIDDGITGLLVEPENPRALADKILFLLDNADFNKKLGHKAKEVVSERFRIQRTVEETEQLFYEITRNRGAAQSDRKKVS